MHNLIRRAGHPADGGIAWSGVGTGSSAFDPAQVLQPLPQAAGAGTISVDPLWEWLWDQAADEFRQ